MDCWGTARLLKELSWDGVYGWRGGGGRGGGGLCGSFGEWLGEDDDRIGEGSLLIAMESEWDSWISLFRTTSLYSWYNCESAMERDCRCDSQQVRVQRSKPKEQSKQWTSTTGQQIKKYKNTKREKEILFVMAYLSTKWAFAAVYLHVWVICRHKPVPSLKERQCSIVRNDKLLPWKKCFSLLWTAMTYVFVTMYFEKSQYRQW